MLKLWIPFVLFQIIFSVLLRNGHFHNVVSTFTNVAKLDVENGNVVSTLSDGFHDSTFFDVVNSNGEIHNIDLTLFQVPTSYQL